MRTVLCSVISRCCNARNNDNAHPCNSARGKDSKWSRFCHSCSLSKAVPSSLSAVLPSWVPMQASPAPKNEASPTALPLFTASSVARASSRLSQLSTQREYASRTSDSLQSSQGSAEARNSAACADCRKTDSSCPNAAPSPSLIETMNS
eukprot:1976078-Rhodomonas_salina.1